MTDISRKTEKRTWYRRTKNLRLLEKFIDSGEACMKMEEFPQKSIESLHASLINSIERFRMYGIVVTVHKRELYLINTSKLKRLVYPD